MNAIEIFIKNIKGIIRILAGGVRSLLYFRGDYNRKGLVEW
jgi:hypothetical protein